MMDREIIDFPGIFAPALSDWIINVRGRSTDDAVDGSQQVIYGVTPRWEVKLDYSIAKATNAMTWDAFIALMRGRTNILRIRVCDRNRPTLGRIGVPDTNNGGYGTQGVPHSDDAFFSDDSGYGQDVFATVATAASAGDTSIVVDATGVNDYFAPGHFISINDWLYRIVGIEGSGTETTYHIEMPLREAAAVGAYVDADARTLMTFLTDLEGRFQRTPNNRGAPSLQLVEWTRRS